MSRLEELEKAIDDARAAWIAADAADAADAAYGDTYDAAYDDYYKARQELKDYTMELNYE